MLYEHVLEIILFL